MPDTLDKSFCNDVEPLEGPLSKLKIAVNFSKIKRNVGICGESANGSRGAIAQVFLKR